MSLDLGPVDRPADRIAPYATITLPAEVGLTNADQVREELLRAIDDGPELLIVDMTETSYFAAAGVHVLVDAPTVRRILQLTGADRLIDVYPALDAATTGLPVMNARMPR